MKRKSMLLISIVSGLACAACVLLFLRQVEGQAERERAEALARYGGDQLEVCVAVRDIAAGETISAGDVELRTWLVDMLPDEALLTKEEAVGERVSSPVLAGEVLSRKRFVALSDALEVPSGLTAVSLPSRDSQAVGGAISAGCRVDVYATGAASTSLIASRVLVLSVSPREDGLLSSSSNWITIAADPASVQELVAAAQTMDLYFVLPGANVPLPAASSTISSVTDQGDQGVGEQEPIDRELGEQGSNEQRPSEQESFAEEGAE